jgi:hypothetical protein
MAEDKKFNIIALVNQDGCFDLQFRKDARHERTNTPTYYRWKMQFIVTSSKTQIKTLEKIKEIIGCGKINISGNQARYSVQKIDEISTMIIPFFRKNALADKKKKNFELWQRAALIIQKNKGKSLLKWKRNEFLQLIELQKSSLKYKENSREPKWIKYAQDLAKSIPSI